MCFPFIVKLDLINQERLIANEFIQCRKVCEHVLEKVLGADLPASTGNSNSSQNNSQSDANSESSQVPAEERIELLCNDVVSLLFFNVFTLRYESFRIYYLDYMGS